MEAELLEILKCIHCDSNDLDLKIIEEKNGEIYTGEIICKNCHNTFLIKRGIAVMLQDPTNAHFEETKELKEISSYLPPTKKIVQLIKRNSKGLNLDAGCGPGGYLNAYQGEVVAVDVIPYFLTLARERYKGKNKINYVAADARKLPFRDNVFNFTVCSSVLEHLEESELSNSLKELERITSGLVQVDTPNYSKFMRFMIEILIKVGFFKLSQRTSQTVNELYHHCFVTSSLLKKKDYIVKGCLGQISRGRLKCKWLADLYDILMYNFPYLAGTLIGFKNMKSKKRKNNL